MQTNTINKTVVAMRGGLLLGLCYVFREVLSELCSGNLWLGLFVSIFLSVLPIILVFRLSAMYCAMSDGERPLFGKAFGISLRSYFFASLIYCVFFYLYLEYVNPDPMVQGIAAMEEVIKQMFAEKEAEEVVRLSHTLTPASMLPGLFVHYMLSGAVISLIVAAVISFRGVDKEREQLQ